MIATNAHNSKLRRDSTTGAKGVSWSKSSRKWHAYVFLNGRRVLNLMTPDFNTAVQAAREAREKYHGQFCNHGDTL